MDDLGMTGEEIRDKALPEKIPRDIADSSR
jgi:hypothetical protein